jgi:hypothetical protein
MRPLSIRLPHQTRSSACCHVQSSVWVQKYRDISMPLSENNDVANMIFGVLQFET